MPIICQRDYDGNFIVIIPARRAAREAAEAGVAAVREAENETQLNLHIVGAVKSVALNCVCAVCGGGV